MNMNNTVEYVPEPKLAYALVFGFIMALGLLLNAMSLWTFLRHHSLKSPSTVFMVNLVISDLLFVFSLPMRVYFYATGTWPLGPFLCVCTEMLFRNNIRSSSIFITFICVDRLLAVVYPLRSRHLRTSSNASKAAALVWLFVLAVNVPESVNMTRFLNNYNISSCFVFSRYHATYPYRSANTIFQFVLVLIMLAVNVVSTALVSWSLHKHLNDSARVNNTVNVMLIFVMSLVMFIICFLPVSVAVLKGWRHAMMPSICLASVNCCLDPLLYYFSLDAFWKKKEDADLARSAS